MAVKKIVTVPNSLLRKKSKPAKFPADKQLKSLVADLIDTAEAAREPEGVGLSAVQIGKLTRVFVVKIKGKFIPFINPQINWRSKRMFSQALKKDELFLEGCLSIPGFYGVVDRPFSVKMAWQDLEGKKHQKKFENKESAYVQHELDHLNAILFTDHVLKQKNKIYRLEKDNQGKETMVEVEI